MKDSSVKFDHQFCERLNQEYRKLHNNNYAMLGDLKYFFYFTPQNFELYEILSAISNKKLYENMEKQFRTQNRRYFNRIMESYELIWIYI